LARWVSGTSQVRSSLLRRGGGASAVPASRERSFFEFELELELCRQTASEWETESQRIGTSGASRRCLVPRCLTIASEGRETWTAWSLREGLLSFGLVVGVRLRAGPAVGLLLKRPTTVTFQNSSRFHESLRGNAVRRAFALVLWERMCLELVNEDGGAFGAPPRVTGRDWILS